MTISSTAARSAYIEDSISTCYRNQFLQLLHFMILIQSMHIGAVNCVCLCTSAHLVSVGLHLHTTSHTSNSFPAQHITQHDSQPLSTTNATHAAAMIAIEVPKHYNAPPQEDSKTLHPITLPLHKLTTIKC